MKSYLVGTPFEEEEISKKQNFYNQKARDEKGHVRFHGAFTGGFSAGYKGTCGSEEGFVPKAFISSRAKRAEQSQQQSVLDFMDEEDLGYQKIGLTLTAKKEYSQDDQKAVSALEQKFGINLPDDVVSANQISIGQEILHNLKKKNASYRVQAIQEQKKFQQKMENQGEKKIGRVDLGKDDDEYDFQDYLNEIQNEDKYDRQLKTFQFSNDKFYGLGYTGVENDSEEVNILEEQFWSMIKRKEIVTEEEEQQKKIENRVFMSFKDGVVNQQYTDFALKDDADIEEYEKLQPNKKVKTIELSNQLNNLVIKDVNTYQIPQKYQSIEIPKDYNPYKKVVAFLNQDTKEQKIQQQQQREKSYKKMTVAQRTEILNDEIQQNSSSTVQMKEQPKQMIQEKKKQFVKGQEQEMGGKNMNQLFYQDRAKQDRYLQFCSEKEGKVVGGIGKASLMSWDEIQREKLEFENLYSMFQSKDGEAVADVPLVDKTDNDIHKKISDLQEKLEKAKNFRIREKWMPEKLLCKRIGVPPPYEDKDYAQKRMQEERQKQTTQQKDVKFGQGQLLDNTIDKNDPSYYGLPTQFKSNKHKYYTASKVNNCLRNNDYQEQIEEREQNQIKSDNDDNEDDNSNSEEEKTNLKTLEDGQNNKINSSLLDETKSRPSLALFKSIFDDEEEENVDVHADIKKNNNDEEDL